MKAYSALLAIRANQRDVYSRTDPMEPGAPASPTTPTGDRAEPIAQLRLDEIQVDTSDLSTVLGSGGYGNVYAGRCRSIAVAVKIIKGFDPKSKEQFTKEAQLLSTIYHPNICLFLGACFGPPLMLVSELLENGDLDKLLKSDADLSLFLRLRMMRDVARALCWLHDRASPILHRDLKPANVLIDSRWVVKVCDFGLSEVLTFKMGRDEPGQGKGSPLWMSPEILSNKNHFFTTAADCYSFGVVLWQCLTRVQPWTNVKDFKVLKQLVVEQGKRPIIPESCSPPLRSLIERCWAQQPEERPAFDAILSQLESLLVDVAIQDAPAAEFWRSKFLGKEFVRWKEFEPAMKSFLKLESAPDESDESKAARAVCVQTVLGVGPSGVVNIEMFGRVLNWLGPWETEFPGRVERLLRKAWFHGDVPTDRAQEMCTDRAPGTFLVRFSNSKMGSFTVTRMSSQGVINLRIDRDAKGMFVFKHSPPYPSLVDLLENEYQALGVTAPAPGSPYLRLFTGATKALYTYESNSLLEQNGDDTGASE